MNPILYASSETAFNSNGLGILADAVSCLVTEERNGIFELEMTYPVSGIHYGEIASRCLILAKPNPVDDPQPFRIYRITKPMGGVVTVYAEHISYDLSGIPVSPFTASSAATAMQQLKSASAVKNPFTFWTDKSTTASMKVTAPASVRSLLGGREGSVLDVYGGEYKFDRYTVRLYNQRGQNRGVSIRYGKNLTDITQDENIASVYTGVYPYWADVEGQLIQLPEKILAAEGTYDFTRIMTLDLSGDFQEAPTVTQLRERAQSYMRANNIGIPKVSLEVSFVPLEQTEEYKNLALLERVELCDTVNVEFPALGVSATAKCVKTMYDALLGRYRSVELGDARTNIADTIAAQQQKIEQAPTITDMRQAVDSATSQITGNKGGYVVLHSSTGSKEPDEILIMDTPDIKTATKVWRWNKAGLGYSSSGYNGPYGLAMTQDGAIVADFITTGILTANIIKAGVLQSVNQVTTLFMESGQLFFILENGGMMLGATGISFHRNSDSAILGMLSVDDTGKSFLKADTGQLEDFYVDEINVMKSGILGLQIKLSDTLVPQILSDTEISIPNEIVTQYGITLEDENGKEVGFLRRTANGGSGIKISQAEIEGGVWARQLTIEDSSGNQRGSFTSSGLKANQISIEDSSGTQRGVWTAQGSTSRLSVGLLMAQSVTTDTLTFDEKTVFATTIKDGNGKSVRVLAVSS